MRTNFSPVKKTAYSRLQLPLSAAKNQRSLRRDKAETFQYRDGPFRLNPISENGKKADFSRDHRLVYPLQSYRPVSQTARGLYCTFYKKANRVRRPSPHTRSLNLIAKVEFVMRLFLLSISLITLTCFADEIPKSVGITFFDVNWNQGRILVCLKHDFLER